MAVVLDQSGNWSDSTSGLSLVAPVPAGVWVAVVTLPAALNAGDEFDILWWTSLDGGSTNQEVWSVDGVDSTWDLTKAIVSPPVVFGQAGSLYSRQTIAAGPIVFDFQVFKVSDVTV